MRNFFQRAVCLLLVAAMAFTLAACGNDKAAQAGPSDTDQNAATENPFAESVGRDTFEYENLYIQQHLDFIAGSDYAEITAVTGGLPSVMADTYEDAKLNAVNGTWDVISKATATFGEGKLELVNEYEILVSELMQNTGAEEGFVNSFQENYYDAVIQLLNGINSQLKTASSNVGFFTGDSIDKVGKLTESLDAILIQLQKLQGVSDEAASGLYADALKKVKEAFNESYLKENEAFLTNVKDSLSYAGKFTSLVSDSITEMMDEYLLYEAISGASEEWTSVWTDISQRASRDGSDEGKKIAACIDKILERTEVYRQDNAAALTQSSLRISAKNLGEFTFSCGYQLFDGMMKSWPVGKAIREGLVKGVSLSNLLMNVDDIAYYGQMIIGYGRLAEYAFGTMQSMEKNLIRDNSYRNALLFDTAFQIYKEIQLDAADCTINYCSAIAVNPVGYIFKYTSDDEIAGTFMMQIQKAEWSRYRCHGVQQVINNGGNVVGYNGSVYYFRMSPDSLSNAETNAAFLQNSQVENELVCHSADGEEKVLLKTASAGPIYICGGKILYQKYDYVWYGADLTEPVETEITNGTILDYLPVQDMLVIQGVNGYTYATDLCGNQMDIFSGEYFKIASDGAFYYYYAEEEGGFYTFFRYNLSDQTTEILDSVSVPDVSGWGRSMSAICVNEDGIYFLIGYYGGTGFFFQEGDIYFLSFATGETTQLVDGTVTYPMMYLGKDEAENSYLYYYGSGDVLGVSLYQGCLTENISRIDLKTMETTLVSFPLCEEGVPFIHGTELQILENGSIEPTTILSDDIVQKMGYPQLGIAADGTAVYHKSVDLVGDTYYITMMEVCPDDSVSIGWRQGYRRVSTKLFAYTIGSDEPLLIHSY